MEQRNDEQIRQAFKVRRARQAVAIGAAILFMVLAAVLYRHPEPFGEVSKGMLVKAQVLIVLLFVNFTALNWRCPACRKHLGNDIGRSVCRRCGARLR